MSKQSEVFESNLWEITYNNGCSEKQGVEITKDVIKMIDQAIQNGDIYLKADVERKEIEAMLKGLKYANIEYTNPFIVDKITELETKLQELK